MNHDDLRAEAEQKLEVIRGLGTNQAGTVAQAQSKLDQIGDTLAQIQAMKVL